MIKLQHKNFSATILKQGAQIIEFKLNQSDENVLWSTEISQFEKGKPFRGGIPICWPWFGKKSLPAHGFARIMDWELIERLDSEESSTLKWKLQDTPYTRAIWNHVFELYLIMKFSQELSLRLEVHTDTYTTGAFHTYFSIQNINHIEIDGLGSSYIDALQMNEPYTEKNPFVKITGEVDRIYTNPETILHIYDNKKRIQLQQINHSDTVLWNPGKDLGDMNPHEYLRMVCVETSKIKQPFENNDFMSLSIKF